MDIQENFFTALGFEPTPLQVFFAIVATVKLNDLSALT